MKRGAVATIVVGWALEIVSDLGMASIEAEDCDGVGIGWHGSNVCSACRLLPPSEFGRVLAEGSRGGCSGSDGTGSSMKSPGGRVEYVGTLEMFGKGGNEGALESFDGTFGTEGSIDGWL